MTTNNYMMSAEQLNNIRKEAGRFNEPWTAQEKTKVVELFRDGKRIEEIACMQGRTKNAIKLRLVSEGEILPYLSRRGVEWTPQEVERLGRCHSQGYQPGDCARLLGRTSREARDKLMEIGLLEPSSEKEERGSDYPNAYEPWTEEELSQLNAEIASLPLIKETILALSHIAENHGRSFGSILSRVKRMSSTELKADA